MSDDQIEIDDDRFRGVECPDCEELSIRLDVQPNVCTACGKIFNPDVIFSEEENDEPSWDVDDDDDDDDDDDYEHRGNERSLHEETY